MSLVFVVDKNKQPCNPCQVAFAAEIEHRGNTIRDQLLARGSLRRSRRNRKTRYRQSRFDNRTRPAGWLAPSLQSRIDNTITWVHKLIRYCPIGAISQELVRFDTQLMQNAHITGVEYQQGTLAGYEVREYLLEKFHRSCVYCKKSGIPLEIEHIIPKSRGGSSRISNFTLACTSCNQAKGNKTVQEFGHPEVHELGKTSLRDAAAMNSVRWHLYHALCSLGLLVETGTGGRTKYNRNLQNLPKAHWLDAACVGASTPSQLMVNHVNPLLIKAIGHGSRQMCRVDKYGFPRTSAKSAKKCFGFQTGDIICARVPHGKKKGKYLGKVAIRTSGSFNIVTPSKTVQGISYRFCKIISAAHGYSFSFNRAFPLRSKEPSFHAFSEEQ